jgi:hypothetical protein
VKVQNQQHAKTSWTAGQTFLSNKPDTGEIDQVAHGVEEGENGPIASLLGECRNHLRIRILVSHDGTAINKQAPPGRKLTRRPKYGHRGAYFPSDVMASWTKSVLPLPWGPWINVIVQAITRLQSSYRAESKLADKGIRPSTS